MNNEPTSAQLLPELHRLLALALIDKTRKGSKPTAELLGVARRLLGQEGLLGRASGEQDRARLHRLYDAYVKRLGEALHGPNPSAAMLAEARLFVASQGIGKDLGAAVDTGRALQVLGDVRLPFND